MTTTLRPAGPERRDADGARARPYTVCVNSRPVGRVELATDLRYGPAVGRMEGLFIEQGDRRRGRGTVATLAGEEVLRSWGCTQVELSVPPDAEYALRLATALGYTETARHMAKDLGRHRHRLPDGSSLRPLAGQEHEDWRVRERENFITVLTESGVPRPQAEAREASSVAMVLPLGVRAPGNAVYALDHAGRTVGRLWLRTAPEPGWVLSVAVDAAHRGRGHGRSLMLAAENACRDAGVAVLALNVFAGNTPAARLYESLGYRTTRWYFGKSL